MKITAKKGKGNKMHIFTDDEYTITVTADFWFSGSIRQGDEISEESFAAFREKANYSRAYNKALDLISRRDYCRKELEEKLSKTIDKEPAKCAAQKVIDLGFINDELYAAKYAEEMYRRKGYSLSKIKMELIYKGIERDIVDKAIESIDFDAHVRIIELLEKKYARQLDDEKGKMRAVSALIRLGYSYADVRAAMRDINIETPDE